MLHIGQYSLTPSRVFAVLALAAGILAWANVSVASLPLLAVAAVCMAIALLI